MIHLFLLAMTEWADLELQVQPGVVGMYDELMGLDNMSGLAWALTRRMPALLHRSHLPSIIQTDRCTALQHTGHISLHTTEITKQADGVIWIFECLLGCKVVNIPTVLLPCLQPLSPQRNFRFLQSSVVILFSAELGYLDQLVDIYTSHIELVSLSEMK